MSESHPPHPFVKWGQNETHVFLSVQLADAEDLTVEIEEEKLHFSALGTGSQGRCFYQFTIDYYLPVLPKQSRHAITGRAVLIKLQKEYKDTWIRLTARSERLPWARLDFDLYQFEASDLEPSDPEDSNLSVNVVQPSKEERERHNAEMKALEDEEEWEAFLKILKHPLTIYLLLFNLFQFAGFLCVFGVLLFQLLRPDSLTTEDAWYEPTVSRLAVVQAMQFLEPLHAALGWVRGKTLPSLMQVCARALILYTIVVPHAELNRTSTVFWLFFVWSAIELVRYPFYISSLLGFRSGLLTYLRFTLWIPLYPIGFICEGKLVIRALPLLTESGRFTYPMPNPFNMSFDFPIFLHFYLLCAIPCFYFLMRHMYLQRRRVIGPRPRVGADQMGFFSYIPFLRSLVQGSRNGRAVETKSNRSASISSASKLAKLH